MNERHSRGSPPPAHARRGSSTADRHARTRRPPSRSGRTDGRPGSPHRPVAAHEGHSQAPRPREQRRPREAGSPGLLETSGRFPTTKPSRGRDGSPTAVVGWTCDRGGPRNERRSWPTKRARVGPATWAARQTPGDARTVRPSSDRTTAVRSLGFRRPRLATHSRAKSITSISAGGTTRRRCRRRTRREIARGKLSAEMSSGDYRNSSCDR